MPQEPGISRPTESGRLQPASTLAPPHSPPPGHHLARLWAEHMIAPPTSCLLVVPPSPSQPSLPPVSRQLWPRPAMAPEDHEGATSLLQSFERRFLAARALPSFPWQVGGGRAAGIGVEHRGRRGREARAAFAHRWTWGRQTGPSQAGFYRVTNRAGLF